MRTRDAYLLKSETLSDSQTKIVDVDLTDPVSEIIIIYQANNGATSNQQVLLRDNVSKIELVDGSDVLFSLSGMETVAMDCYHYGAFPPALLTEAADATQYEVFKIPFGRKLWDKDYWLDPTRYTHLQLKLTHSLTISDTAGFATGTGKATVIAKLMEDKPAGRKGTFMCKSLHSWTSAASGDEVIDLPTDYPYRTLFVRGYEHGTAFNSTFTNFKLTCDTDKFIPFDLACLDAVYQCESKYTPFIYEGELLETDNDTVRGHLAFIRDYEVTSRTDLDFATADAVSGDELTLAVTKTTTTPSIDAETADVALGLLTKGAIPENTIAFPFGDPSVDTDWFPAASYKNIKLKVTQGDAGATCSVFLQQVRP
jgi:hypothetical protein